MAVPRISVVVPFFNIEEDLGDCLDSIAAQTFADLEVIMVDYGSTDGSTAIAQRRAAADPRFTLVRVPNHGPEPGYARNRGVEHARGEFLAFVDADDMLPPHAYEKLLHTLESSGSDFVSGQVERIGPAGIQPSVLHARALKGRRTGTHISKTPALFNDVSVFNKLFRRSFWDANKLTYPEGMVWEDLQLMTRAHVLARAVDVIPDPIYYWRERGRGALSITQSRTDIANLRDRITALSAIDAFLRERGTPRLLRQHQRKALMNDLWLYVCDLARASESYRAEFMRLAGGYLTQVGAKVLASLPATRKLAYFLIRTNRLDQLIAFNGWQAEQPSKILPVLRRRFRLVADLPFRTDRELGIPARIYRPHYRELDPLVRIDEVGWAGGRLVISGFALVPSIDITRRRHTTKIIVLRPRGRLRPPVVLPARSFRHYEAAAWSGQERYCYDWAGFRCQISPRWFRLGRRWLTGEWECFVLVRARGAWRASRLHTPNRGPAERPEPRWVAPAIRMGARWAGRQLHLGVTRTPAVLHGAELHGAELHGAELPGDAAVDGRFVIDVDVDLPGDGAGAELVLARPRGAASQAFAATASRADGKLRLRAEIPFGALAGGSDPAAQADAASAGPVELDLCVRAGRGRLRVAYPAGLPESRLLTGGQEYALERTRYHNAILVRRPPRPVIDEHSWDQDGQLTLSGRFPAVVPGRAEVLLRRQAATEQHAVPLHRDGDRFTVTIPATRMPVFGDLLPLREGWWDILVRRADVPGGPPLVPAYDHARLARITDESEIFGPKAYRFSTTGYDAPLLTVIPAWQVTGQSSGGPGPSEPGEMPDPALRTGYYPRQRALPVTGSVLFTSWQGSQCAGNPRGIADELRRRGDSREHIWVITDPAVAVPDGARAVVPGTRPYFDALARCGHLITDGEPPPGYQKRDGQLYVQTWQGTPAKRIGFDVEHPQFIGGISYFSRLAADVARWDLLLSPSTFATPVLRRALRYSGEICESGNPRNDVLYAGDAARADAVRRRLGLPEGKRVVLYAPTWRDNQYFASGDRYRFDFRLDLERAWTELGDDYVFLIRGHHYMADDVPAPDRPSFAVNVTGYPDIGELFGVADALITDYSSAMFDFAPTGRPVLFFAYDLAQYRDSLRGFYFDYETTVPGPVLASSAEVIAAVGDLDSVARQFSERQQAFAARFCTLDDGKAAARACDRIFGA